MSLKLFLLAIWCVSGALSVPVTWTQLTANFPFPPARWSAGMAMVGGTGYLFGGEGNNGVLGEPTCSGQCLYGDLFTKHTRI